MSGSLNREQMDAVQYPWDKPLRVIAGAGTGKTTVLVQRYLHLLESGLRAENLLALTFSNKASAEMVQRLTAAIPQFDPATAWVTTFHSFALRLLRSETVAAGIDPKFMVIDEAGAHLAFDRACRDFLTGKLQNEHFQPGSLKKLRFDKTGVLDDIFALISRLKDSAVDPEQFMACCLAVHGPYYEKLCAALHRIPAGRGKSSDELSARAGDEFVYEQEMAGAVYTLYRRYQQELERRRALDFGDLIQRACRLLEAHPERRRHYQDLFRHILIDEFQDTSEAQFLLIRLLARDDRLSNVTAVGDDKQAIYGWRNARVENMRDFKADQWGGKSLTVRRNYRSFGEILQVAGDAIARSSLFADRPDETQLTPELHGFRKEPTVFVHRGDDEPQFLAAQIQSLLACGYREDEIVILMRSLRGAKRFEDALLKAGVPYRTVGGMGFYDREEVKDMLSLLRLAENPFDSLALLRLLTRPPFAVSDRFLSEMVRLADAADSETRPELCDLLSQAKSLPDFENRGAGVAQLERLSAVLDELSRLRDSAALPELILHALRLSGYVHHLETLAERDRVRSEANVHKLAALSSEFARGNPSATLGDFLSHVEAAMRYDVVEGEADVAPGGAVRIMTVHQSKGLEFPVVFVANVAPGKFPAPFRRAGLGFDTQIGLICSRIAGEYSMKGAPYAFEKHPDAYAGVRSPAAEARCAQQEEERRLWYVALTRSQKLLFLTGPDSSRKGPDYLAEVADLLKANPLWGAVLDEPFSPAAALPQPSADHEAAPSRESARIGLPVYRPLPPASPAGSVSLSFSTLRTFMHCPLRYYFCHRWGFPLSDASANREHLGYDPAILGTAVHRALSQGRCSGEAEPGRYLGALVEACRSLGLGPPEIQQTYVPLAKGWLESYAAGPMGAAMPGECWEKEFVLELEAPTTVIRFRGFIDHLVPGDDGLWDVIDYKTNRNLGEGEIRDYSLQLQLYALACRNSLGIEPHGLYLYHLPTGSLRPVDNSRHAMAAAERNLIMAGEAVAAGRLDVDFGLTEKGCRHCPVPVCPRRSAEEPGLADDIMEDYDPALEL